MPRMNFETIYTRIEDLTNITSRRALIKDAIQWSLDSITNFDLQYLMTEGFFTTVAPYETGTVTATNGSTTITGSGTTFTSAMVGRKIRVGSDQAYYRIKSFTSTTEVILEAPYGGTTASGATYSIYKDEYRLAPDLDVYKVLRQIENGIALGSIDATAFDIVNPTGQGAGTPRYEISAGTKLDTYTTGTLTGTLGASVLTGTNTAWTSVEGLAKGSRITIGSYTYTVKSVDSATQITIYETLLSAPSGSAYTIHLDNYIVQLSYIPDSAENIYYRYQRVPYPLINATDIPDLPEKFHDLLIMGGSAWAWQTKDKDYSATLMAFFEAKKLEAWGRMGNISQARIYRRKSMDNTFPSNHGQPYSTDYGLPVEL